MTDADIELFLTLKFGDTEKVLTAFRVACGIPVWAITTGTNPDIVASMVRYWAEKGAPDVLEITKDNAEQFLILKFGSVDAAWDYVMSRPPGEHHGLSDAEIITVMDYVKPLN